jgi:hypothetical protein
MKEPTMGWEVGECSFCDAPAIPPSAEARAAADMARSDERGKIEDRLKQAEESMTAWIKYAQLVLRPKVIKYIGKARYWYWAYHRTYISECGYVEENQRLRNKLKKSELERREWVEREAVCCPEDVPFDEMIKAQADRIAELEAALNPTPDQGAVRDAE